MKSIFRFTIALYFTENLQKLTQQDLDQALRATKYPYADRYKDIVEYTKPCIQQLIKTLARESISQAQVEIIKSHFEKLQIDFNAEDLVQVWESEKPKVISKILKDSVKTGQKFNSLRWQVSNNISNKHSVQTEPTVSVNLGTAAGRCEFEVGKKKMKKILSCLGSAQEFLDQQLL